MKSTQHSRQRSSMVSLGIELDRRGYAAGDTVSGRVILRTKLPIALRALNIKVIKRQSRSIHRERGRDGQDTHNTRSIQPHRPTHVLDKNSPAVSYDHCFTLLADDEIGSGEHIFPFTFTVARSEGASINTSGIFHDVHLHLENSYVLEALCSYDGSTQRHSVPLIVHNRTGESSILDTRIKIQSVLCLYRTTYLFRLTLDKSFYLCGETARIRFFPVSIIKARLIEDLQLSLYEILVLYEDDSKLVRSRLVSKQTTKAVGRNEYESTVTLPTILSTTFTEENLLIRIALFFRVVLLDGAVLTVKKYVDVGRAELVIPEIEEEYTLGGRTYNAKILEF